MQHPDFGLLERDERRGEWVGTVRLPTLANCYDRWAAPGGVADTRAAEQRAGEFTLVIAAAGDPTPEQALAIRYLQANEDDLTGTVIQGLLQAFRGEFLSEWQKWHPWADAELVQHVLTPAGIRETVTFEGLYVLRGSMAGMAYLAFLFNSSWFDPAGPRELVVQTLGPRLMEIGDAELLE